MPEDSKKNQGILKLAAKRFKHVYNVEGQERKAKDYDLRFSINDDNCQWPEEVRKIREDADPPRPCLSINKIPEKIDVAQGEFEQLEPSHKVRPIDSQGDSVIANIIAGQVRHIENTSHARSAYNHSHRHNLVCGKGNWRHDIVDDPDDPFVRSIEINCIPNPLAVYFDPGAKKPDKSDADWCFVVDWKSKDEVEKEPWGKDLNDEWPVEEYWSEPPWKSAAEGYRIAEYWWKEPIERTFLQVERLLPSGVFYKMTVTEDKFQEGDTELKRLKVKRPQVRWCKLVAGKVIDGPHDWPGKNIPIFEESGVTVNIRGTNVSLGKVRNAISPQQLYNYQTSANTEMIAMAPKMPFIVTPAMIANHKVMWDTFHLKNYSYLLVDPDPLFPGGMPKREMPPQMSTAITTERQYLDHDLQSSMGIYAASLGDKRGEESGRSLIAQQKQTNTGTQPFTTGFTTTYVYSIKSLVDLIPHVYDTERILRIVGEDGQEVSVPINAMPGTPLMDQVPEINGPEEMQQQYVSKYIANPRDSVTQYINDMSVGRYDVDVSIGPAFATQRQEMVDQLMRVTEIVARAAPQFAMPIAYAIMENMDLPNSTKLLEQIKKLIPAEIRGLEPGEQPPQPQGPPPELMLKIEELQIKMHEQQRKDFEAFTKAMTETMKAEAAEAGAQMQQTAAFIQQLTQLFSLGQEPAQEGAPQ